jgi:hypothetical protein
MLAEYVTPGSSYFAGGAGRIGTAAALACTGKPQTACTAPRTLPGGLEFVHKHNKYGGVTNFPLCST